MNVSLQQHFNASATRTNPSQLRRLPAKLFLAVAVSTLCFAGGAYAQGQGQGQGKGPGQGAVVQSEGAWVPGRLLVQPRPGLSDAEFEKVLKPVGGRAVGKIEGIDVRIVQLPPQANERAVAALLRANKHLGFVELDERVSFESTNDPHYSKQWHLSKIGASDAWTKSNGSGVIVAILDSGINSAHPDLAAMVVPGWNTFDNNSNTADVHGHGTAVAGAAVAETNNGVGIAGLAAAAQIMPIRVTDLNGYGYLSTIASGLTWAADRGARVANVSFGVAGFSTIHSAAQYMKNKGGVVTVSAGNGGSHLSTAPHESLMVVSATTSSDTKTSWSDYGGFVDLSAPGASIYTTNRGGGYGGWSGTSFAAPITAGVAALVISANPQLTANEVQSLLYATAVDLGSAGKDIHFGHGRVNAYAAAQAAAGSVAKDTVAPTVAVVNPKGGNTVSGLVVVDVSASDNVGVSRVDLHLNGAKFATALTAPYGFSWDSTTVGDGNATLTAYAYDAAGNYASNAVTVKVENVVPEPAPEPAPAPEPTPSDEPVADVIAPETSITSPSNGSKVNGNVNVNANATDNVGVVRMRLFHNGNLMASANGGSISYRWTARTAAVGNHTWKVEADDAAGNTGMHSVTVTR